jgi:hypothetical protein
VAEADVAAGGRRRELLGTHNPAPVFAVLGIGLLAAAVVVPTFGTLLVAWGGTALFVALVLQFVLAGPTLSATVTTDIYETMARNARKGREPVQHRYVPDEGGTLVTGTDERDPVGKRLLATVEDGPGETLSDHLSLLVDVLVNDLELAGQVQAEGTDHGATVTVIDSRVGTGELFDHPVVSVLGVGLARGLDAPIAVESSVEDGALLVSLERADDLLDGSEADQHREGEAAEQ